MKKPNVGIAGIGIYLPERTLSAGQMAEKTKGQWTEEDIRDKLGINQIYLASKEDGTQEMGARAAKRALEDAKLDPLDLDLIISFGEEWKEYPLTTSAIYIQDRLGAKNAWAIDMQNRCCSSISVLKIAKDMIIADPDINHVLIAGGYRNGDFIDYEDNDMSMMYNLSAGGGAMVLSRNLNKNIVLESHIISDASLSRTVAVEIGGTENPINKDNLDYAYKSLKILDKEKMKTRLNQVSTDNWMKCLDRSLEKSGLNRKDIDYLNILHIKRSEHERILKMLNLGEENSIYLSDYGHIGQVDQILSLKLALEKGYVKDNMVVASLAAGIGYVWASNIIKWGPVDY